MTEPHADDDALDAPAPPRPRWIQWAALALAVPFLGSLFGCGLLIELLTTKASFFTDLPRVLLASASLGTVGLLTLVCCVLVVASEKRWRAARLSREGIAFGVGDPGASRVPWSQVEGFACQSDFVRICVRGQRGSRLLSPVIWCKGELMSRVVERLERSGVRRVDG